MRHVGLLQDIITGRMRGRREKRRMQMLHDLANDGGYVALKWAAEDKERWRHTERMSTRSSADADNRLDAFSGQSRSTNGTIPHVTYSFLLCNSNFVFKTRRFYDIRLQKIS